VSFFSFIPLSLPSPVVDHTLTAWYKDTFAAWIPLVWFQQVQQPDGLFSLSYFTDVLY
jgi:hypothetical protein